MSNCDNGVASLKGLAPITTKKVCVSLKTQRAIQSFFQSFASEFRKKFAISIPDKRGYSSVGRASALQAECLRFESACLHQRTLEKQCPPDNHPGL